MNKKELVEQIKKDMVKAYPNDMEVLKSIGNLDIHESYYKNDYSMMICKSEAIEEFYKLCELILDIANDKNADNLCKCYNGAINMMNDIYKFDIAEENFSEDDIWFYKSKISAIRALRQLIYTLRRTDEL